MSLRNCSIPGCILGSRQNNRKLRKKGIHASLFRFPKDPVFNAEWRKILKERKLTIASNFRVCELHFKQKDILFFPSGNKNYKVWYGRNIIKRVKPGSVPCIFGNIPPSAVKPKANKVGLKETLQSSSYKKTKKTADNIKNSTDSSATDDENSLTDSKLVRELHLIKEHFTEENTDISTTEDSFTYNKLVQELHLIKKPNNWWNIMCEPNCITIFKMKNHSLDREVVIDADMDVKVYVDGIKLNITHLMRFTCVNDISSLLKGLECFKLDIKEN